MADAAYGLWPLVILNTALFAFFAVSFFRPKTKWDWRAMGACTAFLVALDRVMTLTGAEPEQPR